MRVLVTGAHGFVGTAVARRLGEAGHEVVALTRRPVGPHPEGMNAARIIRADIRDESALSAALEGIQGVCHLAALTRVRESFESPEEYQAVNAGGTVALLNALARANGQGFTPTVVLGSTAAVFGAPDKQPIREDVEAAPSNPYGASKLAAEEALQSRAEAGHVRAVSLRCFNISGAVHGVGDSDDTRIIPKAVAVAAGRYPSLEMNGDGTAVRDFVHVDDVARAYLLALAARRSEPYRNYNVGATAASMREIVAVVERVTGRAVPIVHRPPQPEPPRLVADTSRIESELGWKPARSDLESIVRDAWSAAHKGH